MNPLKPHRIVPVVAMTAVTAIPALTMFKVLTTAPQSQAAPRPVGGTTNRTTSGSTSTRPTPATTPTAASPTATKHSATTTGQSTTTATATPTRTRASGSTSSRVATSKTYRGPAVADQYGIVQASVTVRGKRIVGVSISAPMDNPRSTMINQTATPILRSETLQAQSANVAVVSGATETSDAYMQSLQTVLQKAGL